MLLGITDSGKDALLNYVGDLVTRMALKYCRLVAAPDDFSTVLAPMVVERYRANSWGQEAAPQSVESVQEGDVSVHFMKLRNNPENFILSNELTDGEKSQLAPYRKLWP